MRHLCPFLIIVASHCIRNATPHVFEANKSVEIRQRPTWLPLSIALSFLLPPNFQIWSSSDTPFVEFSFSTSSTPRFSNIEWYNLPHLGSPVFLPDIDFSGCIFQLFEIYIPLCSPFVDFEVPSLLFCVWCFPEFPTAVDHELWLFFFRILQAEAVPHLSPLLFVVGLFDVRPLLLHATQTLSSHLFRLRPSPISTPHARILASCKATNLYSQANSLSRDIVCAENLLISVTQRFTNDFWERAQSLFPLKPQGFSLKFF